VYAALRGRRMAEDWDDVLHERLESDFVPALERLGGFVAYYSRRQDPDSSLRSLASRIAPEARARTGLPPSTSSAVLSTDFPRRPRSRPDRYGSLGSLSAPPRPDLAAQESEATICRHASSVKAHMLHDPQVRDRGRFEVVPSTGVVGGDVLRRPPHPPGRHARWVAGLGLGWARTRATC
jgi:hypothetical protein